MAQRHTMIINRLHSLLHRPEKGWDPVSTEHAAWYSGIEWTQGVNNTLLDELDKWADGLTGKRVLDLGGGPGHYSIAFAKRKADVTWHDVSRGYRDIAERKAAEHNVRIKFSIGYLEDAARLYKEPFDVVFNRICWYYGFSDRQFASLLFRLVKPGGIGYIDTPHSDVSYTKASSSLKMRTLLNDRLAIKIGHPFPPHGRVAHLFMNKPVAKIQIDYTSPSNDRILFLKK
jgi:2-polyprenyl-3-methyl-5-hydroxy-6-metoxy-1,4-benzoquinol methylase